MSEQRFAELREQFRSATARLAEAADYEESELVRDAVIQRFEFSFELLWKVLQAHQMHEGRAAGGPRQALRAAYATPVLATDDEAAEAMAMLEDRNLASHTYNEQLAADVYGRILKSHLPLLQMLVVRVDALEW